MTKVAVVTGSSSGIGYETSLIRKKPVSNLCDYEKFE
jgi:short-subunit dehydrogenase